MIKLALMNGQEVEVSQEEVSEFITQFVIPNPYWRHTGFLSEEEVFRYFKGKSSQDELKRIALYILVHTENLSFTAYLFDKSEGHPDQCKEFNMPALKKLWEIYQRLTKNERTLEDLAGDVHEMENICLEIGADPL